MALHAGHRESHDFDFFSSAPLDPPEKEDLPRCFGVRRSAVHQEARHTLGFELGPGGGAVRLSFFGGLPMPRLALPLAAPTGPRVASPLDLSGFKLAVAYQRHEQNDLADLAALFVLGETLPRAIGAMRRLYGDRAPVAAAVSALAWFEGRAPSPQRALTADRKRHIERAVAEWRGEIAELPVEAERAGVSGSPARVGAASRPPPGGRSPVFLHAGVPTCRRSGFRRCAGRSKAAGPPRGACCRGGWRPAPRSGCRCSSCG